MQTVKASEFKAKCLKLMDEVNRTGEPIVVTKNGVPVSKLVPYRERPDSLFGQDRDLISIEGDIVSPLEEAWDAEA